MTTLRIFFVAWILSLNGLNAATFEPLTAQEQRGFKNVQEKLAAVAKQPEALIPVNDVRGWLRTKEFLSDGTENWNWERFESNYREKLTAQGGAATAADVAQFGPYKRPDRIEPHREPLKLRIRQSFTDVLAIEDPSQEIDTGRTSDDLEGALFQLSARSKGR